MRIAGVDEAGRGPLAGPVYAAAVILNPARPILGLADSKKLSSQQRTRLCATIKKQSLAYSIAYATVEEIEELNILHASLLAMKRAIESLSVTPEHVLVDGLHAPNIIYPVTTVVRGDQTIESISAASILAKVARDLEMLNYEREYPGYFFGQHKGYGTKQHLAAVKKLGVSPIHRKKFAPIRDLVL